MDEKKLCLFFFVGAFIIATSYTKAETTSADTSEVAQHGERIGPAVSIAFPFLKNPSEGSGDLAFDRILKRQVQSHPVVISFETGNSLNPRGFTPARPLPQSGPSQPGKCSREFPCVAMVHCAPFFDEVQTSNLGCQFGRSVNGACCRFPQQGINSYQVFASPSTFPEVAIAADMQEISSQEMHQASEDGHEIMDQLEKMNIELQARGFTITDPKRSAYSHLQLFRTSQKAVDLSKIALLQTFVGHSLKNRLNLNRMQAAYGLQEVNTQNSELQSICPASFLCDNKEKFYRTSDGSCNNLHNPKWGEATTAFGRILPPAYADGISSPRVSVTGGELPSPRLVSLSNSPDIDIPSNQFTLSLMQWGQFIDHDLVQTPIFKFHNNMGIECCDRRGMLIDPNMLHPECFPITIPAQDPFYSQFGRRCMNFVRSMPAIKPNCTLGHREQMNQVTHFLDGSAVYGSSDENQEALRTYSNGLLKSQANGLLPPDSSTSEEDCSLTGTGLSCFLAGDNRVNQNLQLSSLHTMWLRQHNRIARILASLNRHWKDETLFQETRRVVIAQIQHIVYNEWLPNVLGTDIADESGLLPQREGFFDGYDKFLNPNIRCEFSTAAFRFGHTLVQGMLHVFNKYHQPTGSLSFHKNFFNQKPLYEPKKLQELLRGLFKQPMQSFDNFVVDDLTNRLFQSDRMPFGMDLISLNIQRGRDHGIPSYNELRVACGLPRAKSFDDLHDFVNPKSIAVFRNIYEFVDDIDPFTAGISEIPVNGGILGPTFNCIVRDQFVRLKFGDRFYYENSGLPNSFTEAQLFEIRKTSWANMICENSDNILNIQPLAFRIPGPNNRKVPCSSIDIPKMDWSPWQSSNKGK